MVFVKGGKFQYIQQNRWCEGLELNRNVEGPIGNAYSERPFGVFNMVGNVAEMTYSFHDDGMHWLSYLRGGSWFQSYHSLWYAENGLLSNNQRLKFWWLNQGYNRSSAIGFRCVKN